MSDPNNPEDYPIYDVPLPDEEALDPNGETVYDPAAMEEQGDPFTLAHPAIGAAEVAAHMAHVPGTSALGLGAMGIGFVHAGIEAAHGDANGAMCSLQESIPLLGLLATATGCRFPQENPNSTAIRPEEAMVETCFDPAVTTMEEIRAARMVEEVRELGEGCAQ